MSRYFLIPLAALFLTGYPMQLPYVSIANRQTEIMMRIACEFGLTPASRSRISTPSAPEPNLFDFPLKRPDESG